MIRWFMWLSAGAVLGGIVHLGSVLLLPATASHDVWHRLAPLAQTNRMTLLTQPSPENAALPFMDPAFATAVCLFDISSGPLKLQAPVAQTYTSVAFYTARGIAFYALNDRAAGRRSIELDLMTPEQHSLVPQDEEVTAADRLIVESPTEKGVIVLHALAAEPSAMPGVRDVLAGARCSVQGG